MTKTISPLDVRDRLGDLLNRVALNGDEFIIRRKGKPLAAMVPVQVLERMREAARVLSLGVLDRPRPGMSQRMADLLADQEKHASRKSVRPRR